MLKYNRILLWSLLSMISVISSTMLLTAAKQVVTEAETHQFKGLAVCDLFLWGVPSSTMSFNLEVLDNPIISIQQGQSAADLDVFRQLAKTNSKCLIFIMSADNDTDARAIGGIVESVHNSLIINIALEDDQELSHMWRENDDLDFFPRNIVELRINQPKTQIFSSLLCVQNMGHLNMRNVNLWVSQDPPHMTMTPLMGSVPDWSPSMDAKPVKPLEESMPLRLCPHPLHKRTLRVGYILVKPFMHPEQTAEHGLAGVEMSMMKLMQDKFGFDVSFVKDTSGQFNSSTKEWNGIFGKLIDKKLDFRMGACAPRPMVAYTRFFFYVEYRWATRRPIPTPKLDQFLIVFSSYVWAAMLSILLSFSFLFSLIYYTYQTQFPGEKGLTGHLMTPIDFLLKPFACIMEPNPIPWFPTFSAGRLLLMFWSILALNINNFYVCNLRTNLMRQNYEKQVDSAADVVQRDQTVYCNTATYNAFYKDQKIPNPYLEKAISLAVNRNGLYDLTKANGGFPEAAREDVFDKGSVVATFELGLTLIAKDVSRLHLSRESFGSSTVVFCLRKDAAWKEDFDRIIGRMFDAGIIRHFIQQEMPPNYNLPATKEQTDDVRPFNLHQIVSICYFLLIGLFVATFAFVTELLTFCRQKQKSFSMNS